MLNAEIEERIRDRFEEVSHFRSWREEIPRDDFQFSALKRFIGNPEGLKVLDVGCGKGAFTKRLHEEGARVHGMDITASFVNAAAMNVPDAEFRCRSATAIPFDDDSFDVVYSFEVLEHVPETGKAVAEMARVLRPGGKLMIIDKNILGVHPQYIVPLALYKRYMELRDRWMYPKDFPFREKWFVPSRVLRLMRAVCSCASVEYLPEGRPGKMSRILRYLPFLSMDVAWKGVK